MGLLLGSTASISPRRNGIGSINDALPGDTGIQGEAPQGLPYVPRMLGVVAKAGNVSLYVEGIGWCEEKEGRGRKSCGVLPTYRR